MQVCNAGQPVLETPAYGGKERERRHRYYYSVKGKTVFGAQKTRSDPLHSLWTVSPYKLESAVSRLNPDPRMMELVFLGSVGVCLRRSVCCCLTWGPLSLRRSSSHICLGPACWDQTLPHRRLHPALQKHKVAIIPPLLWMYVHRNAIAVNNLISSILVT